MTCVKLPLTGRKKMMLLKHKFSEDELNLTLELFLRVIGDFFRERLVSVILHGSIVFDDLAPGYGDLDFLAVTNDDLSDEACLQLTKIRKVLRSEDHGNLFKMIEGVFLPRGMLNPASTGKAFWWGTSGERPWKCNQLGWFTLSVIRERGIVIWGEDARHEIPLASHEALVGDVWKTCKSMKQHGRGGSLHSVDWLLTAARLLLWLKEGRLSSKSEAADWGYLHARGAWRELLLQAKQVRLNPSMADRPEVRCWLEALTGTIRDACEEVEHELVARGFQRADFT